MVDKEVRGKRIKADEKGLVYKEEGKEGGREKWEYGMV